MTGPLRFQTPEQAAWVAHWDELQRNPTPDLIFPWPESVAMWKIRRRLDRVVREWSPPVPYPWSKDLLPRAVNPFRTPLKCEKCLQTLAELRPMRNTLYPFVVSVEGENYLGPDGQRAAGLVQGDPRNKVSPDVMVVRPKVVRRYADLARIGRDTRRPFSERVHYECPGRLSSGKRCGRQMPVTIIRATLKYLEAHEQGERAAYI